MEDAPVDLAAWVEEVAGEGRDVVVLIGCGEGHPLSGDPWYRLSARTLANRASVLPGIYKATGNAATISSIRTPVLAFFGTQDVGGEVEIATILQSAESASSVETRVIDGVDHVYTGRELEVAPDCHLDRDALVAAPVLLSRANVVHK